MKDDYVLKASYATCRRLVRRSGSNLARCLWLLPSAKRQAMEALYAFLRLTDDLADQPVPAFRRQAALRQWRLALDQALQQAGMDLVSGFEIEGLASEEFLLSSGDVLKIPFLSRGCPTGGPVFPSSAETLQPTPGHEAQLLEDTDGSMEASGQAILPALVHTVRRFRIPPGYLYAVLDGVDMDVAGLRYETFEQLALYCWRVASAVGLACLCIWGCHQREAIPPAIACGLAFQLTNILRDLKEDGRMGRVYLPTQELARFDYCPEAFPPVQPDERFDQLIHQQVERAEGFYRQGAELWPYLDRTGRRIFGMMYETYRRLLHRIAQNPRIGLAKRVQLSKWEKMWISLRWTLWPSRRWLHQGP
ncbi:MAG: squalene/phytoene synthase family protein [Thermoguttaceae bacterium]|nr:squalene/phytoene synthase family protein [Thermoguttaceae bacterium]MDW8036422.1 phytoene/squalene synthase family protein [Thermoguttaceae bacterium]